MTPTNHRVALDEFFAQDLSQFEPDPEGHDVVAPTATASPAADATDSQWIVWADPTEESAWAAAEFVWT